MYHGEPLSSFETLFTWWIHSHQTKKLILKWLKPGSRMWIIKLKEFRSSWLSLITGINDDSSTHLSFISTLCLNSLDCFLPSMLFVLSFTALFYLCWLWIVKVLKHLKHYLSLYALLLYSYYLFVHWLCLMNTNGEK